MCPGSTEITGASPSLPFFVSLKVTCFSFSDHRFLSGSWTCTIDDTQTLEETARLARCERAATNTAGLGCPLKWPGVLLCNAKTRFTPVGPNEEEFQFLCDVTKG